MAVSRLGALGQQMARNVLLGGSAMPPPANAEALKAAALDRVRRVTFAHASHAMLPEQPQALALVLRALLRGERSEAKLQAIAN
jgi:hypothetical protein